MKKGEIWIVDLPVTHGHEQQGTRPVVIVAELEANIAMVIPCTTAARALRFPHVIELKPTTENGLSEYSVALVFQLRALDKSRLLKKIGLIDEHFLSRIDVMLREMLHLGS